MVRFRRNMAPAEMEAPWEPFIPRGMVGQLLAKLDAGELKMIWALDPSARRERDEQRAAERKAARKEAFRYRALHYGPPEGERRGRAVARTHARAGGGVGVLVALRRPGQAVDGAAAPAAELSSAGLE